MPFLRPVLVIIIVASTLSAITGFSLPRFVLDPAANAVFHFGAATVKATGMHRLAKSLLSADDRDMGIVAKESPDINAQKVGDGKTLKQNRNPIFAVGSGDNRAPTYRPSFFRSSSIFSSAFFDGTPIRFAHLLDLVVETCNYLRHSLLDFSSKSLGGGGEGDSLDTDGRSALGHIIDTKDNWEILDKILGGGKQHNHRRPVILGVSYTQGTGDTATHEKTNQQPHSSYVLPRPGTIVSIGAIYLRAFRPNQTQLELLSQAKGGEEIGMPLSEAKMDFSSQELGSSNSAVLEVIDADTTDRLQKLVLELTALKSSPIDLRQQEEQKENEPADPDDWRERMRKQHEKQRQSKLAQKESNTKSKGTKLNQRDTSNTERFYRVTGNLTSQIGENVTRGEELSARFRLSSKSMLGCLDESLLTILRSQSVVHIYNQRPQNADNTMTKGLTLHYVCPTALGYGRRGMKAFEIPPYAPIEIILVDVKMESNLS